MKIVTILGTRPELIRLSLVIAKLDQVCEHVLVHTGQNYDYNLKDVFFAQLGIREPDVYLGATGGMAEQIGQILVGTEKLLREHQPDRLLLLGDTNSALSAIVAKRMGIEVFHMEAGNRCYDDRVPEEVNRRIVDHCSDVLLPYTERSRQNLLREGFPGPRVYVTGNPILEVIRSCEERCAAATVLADLGLRAGEYFLVTLHRAENVDDPARLRGFCEALDALEQEYAKPVIVSTHPRTRNKLEAAGIDVTNEQLRFLEPFPFFEFITLEKEAFCVLSDSGTVQEECAIFGQPNVTIRDVTERPETIECGSNILSGGGREDILRCVHTVLALARDWAPPPEYLVENVSDVVVRLLMGFRLAPGRLNA